MDASPNQPEYASEIILKSPDGAAARITPHGAQALSWVSADGRENLFLSSKSEYGPGVAIRGGVPIIFPQFSGMGTLPKHGFARTHDWELAQVTEDSAVFWLSEDHLARAGSAGLLRLWPHRFLAEYRLRIHPDRLEMSLAVTNTGITGFSFTAALHTYLRVRDLAGAAVLGLKGVMYRENANPQVELREEQEQVRFAAEVDRLYLDAPAGLVLLDGERRINVRSEGFPDAVVWNPGPEKSAKLSDMQPEGYLHFVCLEAAAAGNPVTLEPGASWRGRQILSV